MYWHGDDMSGWGFALMTFSMALFWGLLIFAVVVLVRYASRTGQQPPAPPAPQPTPEQLLAERFARGEIDSDEYQQRLNVLRGGHPAGTA